jgi:hypothetical protein
MTQVVKKFVKILFITASDLYNQVKKLKALET